SRALNERNGDGNTEGCYILVLDVDEGGLGDVNGKKNPKLGDEQPGQLEGDNYDERMDDPIKGFMDSEYEVADEGGLEEDE
ncbi:Hypothetical predicted protein, partial [Olea europaea subsp. europaea]